jgi:hyperosmotically inducible protein
MLIILFNLNLGYAAPLKKIEENLSDSVITTKLTAKFTKDTQLNPFKVYVSTNHGRVTLKGHVKNKEAFIEAIKVTKSTKGVHSVNADQLEIKPVNTALTDAYITAKVETAILKAKVLDDESIPLVGINATTKDGIVTLTGKIKYRSSIKFILKRTSAVRGVKKVVSKLTVI